MGKFFFNKKPTQIFGHLFLFSLIHIFRRTIACVSPCSRRIPRPTKHHSYDSYVIQIQVDKGWQTDIKNVMFWVQLPNFGILLSSILILQSLVQICWRKYIQINILYTNLRLIVYWIGTFPLNFCTTMIETSIARQL